MAGRYSIHAISCDDCSFSISELGPFLHYFHCNVPSIVVGSPAILGDSDGEDNASDFNYTAESHGQNQKSSERMLSWHMTYGRGEDGAPPNYDKEVPQNNIPLLPGRQEVIL